MDAQLSTCVVEDFLVGVIESLGGGNMIRQEGQGNMYYAMGFLLAVLAALAALT